MRKTSLDMVHRLAKKDSRVIFVGSDLGSGVLDDMREEMPNRWFMEGISEQHIIGMAAGLAIEGYLPYVNTIATFLTRRCYEQLVVDVGLHCAPVRLIGNGGGVVYAPLGPTHQAIEDIGIMRMIPNMTVVAPCDALEMERLMEATLDWPLPIYIRLAKGGDEIVSHGASEFKIGKSIVYRQADDILLVSTGIMTQRALQVANILSSHGVEVSVLHVHTLKPFDCQSLLELSVKSKLIFTLEEHKRDGGLGTIVLETMADAGASRVEKIIRMGLPDRFSIEYGSQDHLLDLARLDVDSLVVDIKKELTII